MYRILPLLFIALIVAGSLAAQEQTGLTLNFAKAGGKTISGLTLESNGVRYMADVTPKGCFLRKTMVGAGINWQVKDPVEGMVVRLRQGTDEGMSWGPGVMVRDAHGRGIRIGIRSDGQLQSDILGAASCNFNDRPQLTPRPFDLRRDGT